MGYVDYIGYPSIWVLLYVNVSGDMGSFAMIIHKSL